MATAAQIAEIRLLSGDNASNSAKYVVSDDILGAWYDDNGSICATVVKVVQARLADASRQLGGSGETTGTNAKVQQIKELLDYVKADCPESYGATTVISLNLGIDEETDLFDIE